MALPDLFACMASYSYAFMEQTMSSTKVSLVTYFQRKTSVLRTGKAAIYFSIVNLYMHSYVIYCGQVISLSVCVFFTVESPETIDIWPSINYYLLSVCGPVHWYSGPLLMVFSYPYRKSTYSLCNLGTLKKPIKSNRCIFWFSFYVKMNKRVPEASEFIFGITLLWRMMTHLCLSFAFIICFRIWLIVTPFGWRFSGQLKGFLLRAIWR